VIAVAGAMWGNKSDQIISYYRPNFHENKNSPEVKIFIQKLKRKRTGGQLGDCDLTLIWAKKRYCNPITGESPCDPVYAKKMIAKKSQDDQQQQSIFPQDDTDPF